MGNLDKVWLTVPEEVSAEELQAAFQTHFGATWFEVLDAADQSFAYNAATSDYYAEPDLRSQENQTLEQHQEERDSGQAPNIIVS